MVWCVSEPYGGLPACSGLKGHTPAYVTCRLILMAPPGSCHGQSACQLSSAARPPHSSSSPCVLTWGWTSALLGWSSRWVEAQVRDLP